MERVELSDHDHALYGKLHVSRSDISIARGCAFYIMRKKWHGNAFLRQGSVYLQQISFTTTMIVAYSRPFSPGKGNISFPARLLQYNDGEMSLHNRLLRLRRQEYAHSDSTTYEIIPLKGRFIKSVDMMSDTFFTRDDLETFLLMTGQLLERVSERMEMLRN